MNDKDKWAAECFRKGNEAMQKQNWDLAVEMFSVCVRLKPDNLTYRQLLRNCTKKKYKDNGKGAGALAGMKLMGIRSKIKKARTAENWEEVARACEEGLLLNPWDAQLNVELAEACRKLDRGEIAKMAYFDACKGAPKDKAIHIALADLLEERAEYQEAVKVLMRAREIDPKDLGLNKRINDVHFKETTHRGGYEEADSTKEVMINRGPAQARPGELVAPGQSQEADLRHAIRKEPDRIENYLKLADYQKRNKKFDEARETLNTALQLSGNDPNVREQLEDVEILMLEQNVEVARERANKQGTDEARQQVAALSNELRNRRIEILSARERRYPANLGLKLELAELYMQLQKWSLAIPLLQKAQQDPRLKTRALVSLGKCFIYDKKLPLARSQFEKAIPDLNFDVDPETYKEAHYLLARVAEEIGEKSLADTHYGEVLVVDYEYKDARERLEKLQGG